MSKFGGFWDSVIDRFSDIALFIGLIYLYSSLGRTDYVMVASFAMMFALMTSYTRARAESLIAKCKVGFMERPERIVLFMIGAFTNRMAGVLWVILVLSVFSVADRVILTYRVLEKKTGAPVDRGPLAAARADAVERVLLDLRARHLAVRRDGDRDPRVRLAHAARLDRGSRWRTGSGRSGGCSIACGNGPRSSQSHKPQSHEVTMSWCLCDFVAFVD